MLDKHEKGKVTQYEAVYTIVYLSCDRFGETINPFASLQWSFFVEKKKRSMSKDVGNRVKYKRKEGILENWNKKDAERPNIKAIVLIHYPHFSVRQGLPLQNTDYV